MPHERNATLDFLKLALSLLVITIHFPPEASGFWSSYLVNEISRSAVPAFFMISGFYLESMIKNGKFSDWVIKIIFIYCSWTFIYYVYLRFVIGTIAGSSYLLNHIGDGWFHLWYFPALLAGMAFSYAIARKPSMYIAMTIAGLLVLLFILQMSEIPGVKIPAYRNFLLVATPCILIGVIIKRFADRGLCKKKSSVGLLLSMTISLVTHFYLFSNGVKFEISPTAIINAITFVIFSIAFLTHHNKITSNFDRLSTGIYLMHPIFMYQINKSAPYVLSYLSIVLCCICTFAALRFFKFNRLV